MNKDQITDNVTRIISSIDNGRRVLHPGIQNLRSRAAAFVNGVQRGDSSYMYRTVPYGQVAGNVISTDSDILRQYENIMLQGRSYGVI